MINTRILYTPVFAIITGISLLTMQPCLAAEQGKDAQATQNKGRVVTLSYNDNDTANFLRVKAIQQVLADQGCTSVVVKNDPDVDEGYIEVSKGDNWADFESSGSAGAYAKSLCDKK